MKRLMGTTLLFLFLLSLTACGPQRKSGTEIISLVDEKMALIIDYDQKTIQNGKDIYRYHLSPDSCVITYPNGALYSESAGTISYDDGYDPQRYIDGMTLSGLLTAEQDALQPRDNFPLDFLTVCGILVILGFGIWGVIAPESRMYFTHGMWRFRNAEPTEFAVAMERIGGWIAIALAVGFFLLALFI